MKSSFLVKFCSSVLLTLAFLCFVSFAQASYRGHEDYPKLAVCTGLCTTAIPIMNLDGVLECTGDCAGSIGTLNCTDCLVNPHNTAKCYCKVE